jgi:hypothetical protein
MLVSRLIWRKYLLTEIHSIEHFRRHRLSREARAYVENILRLYPGATKKTVRQFLAIPEEEVDALTENLAVGELINLLSGRPATQTIHMGHRIRTMDVFNAARRVACERVRPLVDSSQPGATATSLEIQILMLNEKGWLAKKGIAIPGAGDQGGKYWLGLVAPWQMVVNAIPHVYLSLQIPLLTP